MEEDRKYLRAGQSRLTLTPPTFTKDSAHLWSPSCFVCCCWLRLQPDGMAHLYFSSFLSFEKHRFQKSLHFKTTCQRTKSPSSFSHHPSSYSAYSFFVVNPSSSSSLSSLSSCSYSKTFLSFLSHHHHRQQQCYH